MSAALDAEAVRAFIDDPHLGISDECRETLRAEGLRRFPDISSVDIGT